MRLLIKVKMFLKGKQLLREEHCILGQVILQIVIMD